MLHALPNLTVHQLVYVQAALRSPSWTEAAVDLGVTQSAMSQAIAEIERRLGVALFDRRGRFRVPTLAGSAVGAVASEIIASIDDLTGRLVEIETGTRGVLRIGMIDTAALGLLAEPLSAFRTANPAVRTTLLVEPSVALTNRVRNGELDLAAVVIPNPALAGDEENFEIQRVDREPIFVYAPPGVSGHGGSWGPWVMYPAGSQTRSLIEQALSARGIDLTVEAESSNPDVLRQMVRLGVGWCALPASVAENGPQPLLRADPQPLTTRTIALVRRRNALQNGSVELFRSQVAKTSFDVAGSSNQTHTF